MTRRGAAIALALAGAAVVYPSGALRAQDEELSEEELAALMAEDPSLAALVERPQLETGTGIVGQVMAGDLDAPIIEGQVVVVENNRRALTNVDGWFALDVPPGTYTLRIFYQLYQTARLANVVVSAGEATEVEVELTPDDGAVEEEFVVEARADTETAATQLQVRRQSTDVRDAVSAQEIARAGDAAASSAARRVVAATVYDEFLYVRGLGGRYTTVLLDQAPLPQLDPAVPGVQLDLFPAQVLSAVSILKTYNPALPGAFAGGTMLLSTRDYPDAFEAGASVSFGVNSQGTFQQLPSYQGGGLDFLGFDDGTRAIPEQVPTDMPLLPGEDLDRETVSAMGQSFNDDFGVYSVPAAPNLSLGVNVGDGFDLFGQRAGYYLTVGYRSRHDVRRETSETITGSGTDRYQRESDQLETRLSSLGSVSLEVAPGHEVGVTAFFNQSADDYASQDTGYETERSIDYQRQRQRWLQRTIAFGQLSGDHRLAGAEGPRLTWRAQVDWGAMSEPDTRDVLYQVDEDGTRRWQGRVASDGQRLYFDLDQLDAGGGIDLEAPFDPVTIRVGGQAQLNESSYVARRFDYRINTRWSDPSVYTQPPSQLFAAENSGGPWRLLENTNVEDDAYQASEALFAAYVSGEVEITDWLRATAGARVESFRQTIAPEDPFAHEQTTGETARTDVDLLPVVSAVAQPMEDMFVRAAYSATVARPRIRELSGSTYVDYERSRNLFGSPDVKRTLIHSFDLRWELFPSTDEVLAVTGFAKVFEQPIELVLLDDNRTMSFQNVDGARNFGVELEARVSLGRIAPLLAPVLVGANLTLVYSRAILSESQRAIATSDERPLAGQSPWVANASIGVVPPGTGLEVFLYYNVYGPRLDEVGVDPLPDTYEQPFHALDATASYRLHEHVTLRASVQNILLSSYRTEGQIHRTYDPGLTVSAGIAWDM